jgi:hypothetical protein
MVIIISNPYRIIEKDLNRFVYLWDLFFLPIYYQGVNKFNIRVYINPKSGSFNIFLNLIGYKI